MPLPPLTFPRTHINGMIGYSSRVRKYAELRGNAQKHGTKSPCVNMMTQSAMSRAFGAADLVGQRLMDDAFGANRSIIDFAKVADASITTKLGDLAFGSWAAPLWSNPQMRIG